MSPLSFVHSDGTSKTENQNKKLVRSHVSKYFHPKKPGLKRPQRQAVGGRQPRLLAPNTQLCVRTICTSGEQIVDSERMSRDELELDGGVSPVNKDTVPNNLEDNLQPCLALPPEFNFTDVCMYEEILAPSLSIDHGNYSRVHEAKHDSVELVEQCNDGMNSREGTLIRYTLTLINLIAFA